MEKMEVLTRMRNWSRIKDRKTRKNNVNKNENASIKLTFRPTFVGFNPQSVEVKLTLIVRS